MRTLAMCIAALTLALGTLVSSTPIVANAATLDAGESDLLGQINAFRSGRGLATLVVSDTLTGAAKWMSTDMAVNNYFAHTSLDGRTPQQRMADAGYPAYQSYTGEDLAAGYTTAATVLQGWLNSPGHLAVLTNPVYRSIGIGRGYGAGSIYGWYWAADFGSTTGSGGTVSSPSTATATATFFDNGYHDAYVGQSPDAALSPGQVTTLVLALRNAGYRGWYVGSPNQQANLGTDGPTDVQRPELAYGWLSANRITTTTTPYVGPGEVGWFQFQVKAPMTPGVYRLAVRAVIDGVTWLEDSGVFWTITVR